MEMQIITVVSTIGMILCLAMSFFYAGNKKHMNPIASFAYMVVGFVFLMGYNIALI